jgi:PAS domain S-box-containing protein
MPGTTKQRHEADIETLQNLPVAAALFDNNKVYFLNQKAAELFKFPKNIVANPQNISIFSLLDKTQHARIKKNNLAALKGKKFEPIELDFKDHKGNRLFLEIITNTTFFRGKKVIQSTFTEITERKKTEELLRETKEKFELITNNTNDIINFYTYGSPEKYIYVSPNIKRILGYSPEELFNNKNFFNERVSDNRKQFLAIDGYLKDLQRKNIRKNYSYTFKTIKKNKEEIWLENNLTPIADEKGKIRFFVNVLRDITSQKEREIELQAQYLSYQNLLDNAQVAYAIHNQGIIVYCNKELLNTLKLKDKKQMLGKFAVDFFATEDRKKVVNRIKEVYKTRNLNEPHTYHLVDSKGAKVEVEIRSTLIKYNNSPCILSSILNISAQRQQERNKLRIELSEQNNRALQNEIEEKQQAEMKLIERTGRLTSILENTTHMIWTVNRDKQISSFNQNFAMSLLKKFEIKLKEGMKVDEYLKSGRKGYIDYWYEKYDRAFKGEKLEFEREETDTDGKGLHRKIFINPIYDKSGKVTEVSCIAHDITDAKVYEQKLKAQSAKLNAIFESSHHYIWTIDVNQRLTSFNKNYFDLISNIYNTKPYTGLVLNRGILSKNKDYNEMLAYNYKKAFSGEPTNFEIQTLDKNLNRIYLDIFLNPIIENNIVVEVSGIAHDITDKKTDQQKIEQSLKEKEVLLKEVHHRVKNNMQVISSILNLQSSYVSDEYTLSLLKESQNRIKTMAYIHESLYQNKSFTSVNFSDYVTTLANNIVQSYTVGGNKVILAFNLQRMNLSLDHSIPTGLIINELITNAIKHAFINREKGIISINLKSENNRVYLEVKDNGVGLDPSIDIKNTNSLGLQLVNTLVDQIEAEMIFKSEKDKGTDVIITFKM